MTKYCALIKLKSRYLFFFTFLVVYKIKMHLISSINSILESMKYEHMPQYLYTYHFYLTSRGTGSKKFITWKHVFLLEACQEHTGVPRMVHSLISSLHSVTFLSKNVSLRGTSKASSFPFFLFSLLSSKDPAPLILTLCG